MVVSEHILKSSGQMGMETFLYTFTGLIIQCSTFVFNQLLS